MVSDINSVRKGTSEGLSELYTNTNSVQYRAVIDGLAKNDAVAKDLGNLDGRTINFGKTDLNYDAFNKRYYGVIGIMESTQRAIDNIDASKKITPELTLDELEFMSGQNAALSQMDNATTTKVINEPAQAGTNIETFKGNWTPVDVATAKDKVFLFGDNIEDAKTGYRPTSTQAVIRGEENAIGIPTKKNRGTTAASYFTDADFDEFKAGVDDAITKAKASGKTIVLPENGIGTGAAQLEKRAPKCFKYLQDQLNALSSSSQAGTFEASTVSAPRYGVEDFVKIRDINENSKSQITSIIYNMMLNKYGDKEINGKKTFTSSILKDIINQYAYDAYDNVTLNKTHGEGITAAEVIERFNDVFPNM